MINGRGAKVRFGWWDNAEARALTAAWLTAPDAAGHETAVKALSHVAMTGVATDPVGRWYGKTAFRRSIAGVLQGVSPYPWNLRPAKVGPRDWACSRAPVTGLIDAGRMADAFMLCVAKHHT